jgi:hypothetical protein
LIPDGAGWFGHNLGTIEMPALDVVRMGQTRSSVDTHVEDTRIPYSNPLQTLTAGAKGTQG